MPSYCSLALAVPGAGLIYFYKRGKRQTEHCETNDLVTDGAVDIDVLLAEVVEKHPEVASIIEHAPKEIVNKARVRIREELHQDPKPTSLLINVVEDDYWNVQVIHVPQRFPHLRRLFRVERREVEVRVGGPALVPA